MAVPGSRTTRIQGDAGMGGQAVQPWSPNSALPWGPSTSCPCPNPPGICPAQLQVQLRDAGEQVTMAVWQVTKREFVLQNPLLAWENRSSLSFPLVCLCGH